MTAGINTYSYANQNSLNRYDRFGLVAGEEVLIIPAAEAAVDIAVTACAAAGPVGCTVGAAIGTGAMLCLLFPDQCMDVVEQCLDFPPWMSNEEADDDSDNNAEPTPDTNSDDFENVRGKKAKKNKETGEIWDPDLLHKDHWEVYKNKKKFEKGQRDRSVWGDGRPKEKF